MATINNIEYYKHMRNYNLKQLEVVTNKKDAEYYRTCAEHWAKKIEMVKPKEESKHINGIFLVWK